MPDPDATKRGDAMFGFQKFMLRGGLTGAILIGGAPALAAGALAIFGTVQVEQRVAAADGTTRIVLVAPKHVVPGDRLIFTLRYRNGGAQPLGDVVLANPLPRGVAYRAVLPGTPEPEVSVDGTHYAALAALRIGARAATVQDVVAVRWRLARPVAAGASGSLAFTGAVK